jgi:dUTPase
MQKLTEKDLIKMATAQNELQKVIALETGMRERTIKDIELSLIEEILEWNKERGEEFSHKTWKKKEFDKERTRRGEGGFGSTGN